MKSRPKLASSSVRPMLLSPNEVIDRFDKFLILDVQNPKYVTATLPKAQRLNVDIALQDISKTQAILVTCLSGQRSFTAAQQLMQKGYRSVYVLKGGLVSWRQAGHVTQLIKLPA